MKLAIVTNILTPYRVPLFDALAKRVDDLTVLLMARHEENRQWEIGAVSFKTKVLKGFHLKPPGADVSLHWNYGVVAALRAMDPDIVLSGGFAPANLAAYLYCRWFAKAYVGWGEFTLRDNARSSPVRRWLRRRLTSGSAASIASSTEARQAFMHYGAPPHRILTSLMPIDVERLRGEVCTFRATPAYADLRRSFPSPCILSVGRLTDRKGFRDLLTMYEIVVRQMPDVSLLLVGDGPDRPAYESFARERGLRQVHFAGFVSPAQLPRYLALADLFVFPTRSDTYGAALAEAMAAEIPVVSSIFAAATADLVVHGVNGYSMIPTVHDSAAERIIDLLRLPPAERRAMGEAAYRSVKQSDIACSADAMVRFLETVVPAARHAPLAPSASQPVLK